MTTVIWTIYIAQVLLSIKTLARTEILYVAVACLVIPLAFTFEALIRKRRFQHRVVLHVIGRIAYSTYAALAVLMITTYFSGIDAYYIFAVVTPALLVGFAILYYVVKGHRIATRLDLR